MVRRATVVPSVVSAASGRGTFPGSSAVEAMARQIDPKVPVGWIGDVTLFLARPISR